VWNVLGAVPATTSTAVGVPSISSARRARSMRAHSGQIAGGIGALIAACLLLVLYPSISVWLNADYTTGVAQTRKVTLTDGSNVFLAADSAIDVDFEPSRRGVRLLSGEAYFEVAPDATRPFTVMADDVATTVLGTGFDVNMMADGVAVAVSHGRVAVADEGGVSDTGPPLTAGDWVRVRGQDRIKRGTGSPALVAAWRSGKLIVNDEAVGDVVDGLARYYGGKIVMLSPTLSQRRVTGVYNLADPVAALRAVAEAHGGSIQQISPWLVVIYGS
jgi:transmembrane sensor